MSLFPPELVTAAERLLQSLRARQLTLATAESCTGGLLAALLTEIPGSSDVFSHGYVTYANAAKHALLQVGSFTLMRHGAVSEATARQMAEGAQGNVKSSLAIAITGIAGPGGGTAEKPVGLVHLACARSGQATMHRAHHFSGDRVAVRLQAVAAALELAQYQLNF